MVLSTLSNCWETGAQDITHPWLLATDLSPGDAAHLPGVVAISPCREHCAWQCWVSECCWGTELPGSERSCSTTAAHETLSWQGSRGARSSPSSVCACAAACVHAWGPAVPQLPPQLPRWSVGGNLSRLVVATWWMGCRIWWDN